VVTKMSLSKRKFLVPLLIGLVIAYTSFISFIGWAMRQTPETFGRVMARMPGPAYLILPFETMWVHARAGQLSTGDAAPDFSLRKLDKSETIQLSALSSKQPVVLVFGSYT
jgi:sorbitol-specific phosphotransferase system component IIC